MSLNSGYNTRYMGSTVVKLPVYDAGVDTVRLNESITSISKY